MSNIIIGYREDFNIQGTLIIIKAKDSMEFTNPGSLKIDIEYNLAFCIDCKLNFLKYS